MEDGRIEGDGVGFGWSVGEAVGDGVTAAQMLQSDVQSHIHSTVPVPSASVDTRFEETNVHIE